MGAARGNPAPPRQVRAMFDRVAPFYDLMNTLMTAGIDGRWRRAAIRAARLRRGDRALDVACGTGMLTRGAALVVGPGGAAVGIDASPRMLERARRAGVPAGAAVPNYIEGDALTLPFGAASFEATTIGFGLRNMPDYAAALAEMARVAAPGGRVVVLEIAVPRAALARMLFVTWFRRGVPLLGRLLRRGTAYAYLPESVLGYPSPERVAELMAEAGLLDVRWRWLPTGMATLHVGRRPG
ncbi:MAG: ubiquinone/menaquinone biosynthesis methyltransferase [Chloroflexota bacterium]|nr:ubiquinone/menaquinone biosynthesis methyltransferase [Chloroflexota bacterium]